MEFGTFDRSFRSRSGPLKGMTRLFGRSLASIGPALLITVSAFSGFAVRPVIDELVKRPESLRELAHGLRRVALDQLYGVPVIFPDPAPVKVLTDTSPAKIEEISIQLPSSTPPTFGIVPKITPLVPGMGNPRPVKAVRVNSAGSIITEPAK